MVKAYLLVSEKRVRAQLYTLGADGRWTLNDHAALTDSVSLASIGCTIALAEVYDKLAVRGD